MASSSAYGSGIVPPLENREEEEQGANDENKALLRGHSSGRNVGNRDGSVNGLGSTSNNSSKMKLMMAHAWKWLRQILIRCTRVLSLNENSSGTLMAFISSIAVMGILTLNIYSASSFLAWKKDGSMCHIFRDSTSSDKKVINGTIQLIIIGLPFACLPLGLCIGSLAKVAKDDARYWGA